MIYVGEKAKSLLNKILKEDRLELTDKGYFKSDNCWTAFDNTHRECYVEEFSKEVDAVGWVNDYFEIGDEKSNTGFKIFNWLFYIKDNGLLIAKIRDGILKSHLLRLPFLKIES